MVKDDKKATIRKKTVVSEDATVNVFSKEQIVSSKKYNQYQDYLMGNLENDKHYTIQQVDDMLSNIMKGQVK